MLVALAEFAVDQLVAPSHDRGCRCCLHMHCVCIARLEYIASLSKCHPVGFILVSRLAEIGTLGRNVYSYSTYCRELEVPASGAQGLQSP